MFKFHQKVYLTYYLSYILCRLQMQYVYCIQEDINIYNTYATFTTAERPLRTNFPEKMAMHRLQFPWDTRVPQGRFFPEVSPTPEWTLCSYYIMRHCVVTFILCFGDRKQYLFNKKVLFNKHVCFLHYYGTHLFVSRLLFDFLKVYYR